MHLKKTITLALYLSIVVLLSSFQILGQDRIWQEVEKRNSAFKSLTPEMPFQISTKKSSSMIDPGILDQYLLLELNSDFKKQALSARNSETVVSLPIDESSNFELLLYQAKPTTDDFAVYTSDNDQVPHPIKPGVHYWGIVKGQPNSTVAFSVTESDVFGNIYMDNETYTFGKIKDSDQYVMYQNRNLKSAPEFTCFTDDFKHYIGPGPDTQNKALKDADNCVQYYVEVRNNFYNDFNSVQATHDYLVGAFSQVALLYNKENVNTAVQTIYIWTGSDPYPNSSSTSTILYGFRDYIAANSNRFEGNGDLYHLVGDGGNGGIAYVDVLCSDHQYRTGYSHIYDNYNNVPSYSWTVEVLTHELGHNKGSSHTHSCVWDGVAGNGDFTGSRALDDCASHSCSLAPDPLTVGTIMSYCHLTSVGINFGQAHPFGEEPGDLIRNRVYNRSCLSACSTCGDPGTSCDDGVACTTNDVWDNNCNCAGTPTSDSDGDGICNAQDQCPGWNDNLLGTSCNDNDPCTANTIYTGCNTCGGGSPADNDSDGFYCGVNDPDDNDPCNPNSDTLPCLNCTENNSQGFETTNFGIWNDGGTDCIRTNAYSVVGNYSVRLQDNSSSSNIFTNSLNLSSVDFIGVSFYFYSVGLENGEDLWVQVSTNGGSSYTTIYDFDAGDEFQNNVLYIAQLPIQNITLSSNTVIRIVCDASVDADYIYIDELKLYYCQEECQYQPGTSCNDGNPCTVNDVYDANCDCAGTPAADSDGDGICNVEDQCPGWNDNLIGTPCNDNDPCTINTVYIGCNTCGGGTVVDNDDDGYPCGSDDPNDNDPCIPDDSGFECGGCQEFDTESFEGGSSGIWNDGGIDCSLSNSYPNSGSSSMLIRDNSGVSSSFYTDNLSLAETVELGVSFSYYPSSMESGESFSLQISTNGGSTYSNVKTYSSGTDFNNNTRYFETVAISNIAFNNSVRLRFICDASSNTDYVYIDDVSILSCGESGGGGCSVGAGCNDGNPCTTNDQYNSNCDCVGTPTTNTDGDSNCNSQDSDDDNDGVLDGQDSAPLNPRICRDLDGDGCDDCSQNPVSSSTPNSTPWATYSPSTSNDGTDTDGDGICDLSDGCANGNPGDPCDDGQSCTTNDELDANCNCVGIEVDSDNDGISSCSDPNDGNPCIPNSCSGCDEISNDDFESGPGIWNDGGTDCSYYTSSYSTSGSYCFILRDNSAGLSSSMFTNNLNVAGKSSLEISFSYYINSFESGESFLLEIDNGSGWQIVKVWTIGNNLTNNAYGSDLVAVTGFNLTNSTQLRFRCDASSNQDQVYIDDVVIRACDGAPLIADDPEIAHSTEIEADKNDAVLMPNPLRSSDQLGIRFNRQPESAEVFIINTTGKIIREDVFEELNGQRLVIEDLNLAQGTYIIRIHTTDEILIKKLIVVR